jgi:formylglycine-generating enzyme required for sulfatase activity
MIDIFLSYAREDLGRARQLAQALERKGWDVFWDRTIPAGKNWRSYIGEKLEQASCVVVAWSKFSVASNWVIEEADSGLERNVLVPVLLETVRPPLGFRQVHAEDLSAWDGTLEFPAFQKLLRDIESVIRPLRSESKVTPEPVTQKQAAKRSSKAKRGQQRESKDPGTVFCDKLKDGVQGPEMVVIPAGEFEMGDTQGTGDESEKPVHVVRIQKPFAIGRYQIIFEEYHRFASATSRQLPNDQGWGRGLQPAISVSWEDAVEYAKWLSEQSGKLYRLPTEAEWEYAARAGTETSYWWGKEIKPGIANFDGADNRWGGKQPAPVGSFQPNPFGLYDTAGNAWEWVEDCWHENYNSAPSDGRVWKEEDGGQCGQRVIRGGSWDSDPEYLRSSSRHRTNAVNRLNGIGFRIARDIE